MRLSKNILITGGSGFIGSRIADLLKNKHNVICTYYNSPIKIKNIKKIKKSFKNNKLFKNTFFELLQINKNIIEINTINKSGKNGPETKAGGIKISSNDENDNKL